MIKRPALQGVNRVTSRRTSVESFDNGVYRKADDCNAVELHGDGDSSEKDADVINKAQDHFFPLASKNFHVDSSLNFE